jgi:hypothetical protein
MPLTTFAETGVTGTTLRAEHCPREVERSLDSTCREAAWAWMNSSAEEFALFDLIAGCGQAGQLCVSDGQNVLSSSKNAEGISA